MHNGGSGFASWSSMEHPSGDVRLWVGVLQLATKNSQQIFVGYFCWLILVAILDG